ncbi:MAG: trigger factor [Bacteroidales bacterium]|nr:trigger factor [Bacteroidales bacterium]
MKVEKLPVDDLTFRLNVTIEKADALEKRKKALNNYRRTAEIKGFRKGMAPMSLIEKMHGMSALIDAVNDLIAEQLNNYIQENKLNVLGEPLPNDELQKKIDWDNDTVYEFVFDVALAPQVKVEISKDDKIVYYNPTVADADIDAAKSNILKQYGKLEDTDAVKDEDFIVADLVQGETKVEGTYITLKQMSDDNKKIFLGKMAGDSFEINVNDVFTNEADRASLLKVKKEELATIEPLWTLTIKEIKTFVDAEENQELYNKMFGEGVVNSADEFKAKLVERIEEEYAQESEYRFMLDAREYFLNKVNIPVPEAFMKRWLHVVNEGKVTMEEIEKEFDLFLKDFRWQLIRGAILKDNNLTVTKEDVLKVATNIARYQFAMYGINNVPEEHLAQYAEKLLADEKQNRRIIEKAEEDKAIAFIKENVTVEPKEIAIEELRKLNN